MVVHQDHLHRRLLLHDGAEFLDAHLEATVAHEAADGAAGSAEGGTDGSGHAVAHRTETTAGADTALVVVFEVARRKQLVLADVSHEDGIVGTLLRHHVNDLTHAQRTFLRMDGGLDDLRALFLVERLEGRAPLTMVSFPDEGREGRQRLLTVGHDGHISLHVLVNLAGIDVEVDDLRLLSIGLEVTRHTVAEAHTDGDEHVALLLLEVDGVVAVHAQHTSVERMIGGQRGEAEHRATSRDIGFLEEPDELALRIAEFDTLPHQCQRFLGMVDQFGSLAHSLSVELRIRHIGTDEVHLHRLPVDLLDLCILGEVEHHRTRTARAGDVERTAHSPRYILGMTDLIRPLRDRLCHTHEIDLLEGIGTEGTDRHLTSNDDNGRRVKHGISNTCQRIGDTRATGDKGDTHLARHAGIALSGMGSSLFVAHQDMVETFLFSARVVEERVIDGHDRPSGVAEDGLHALCLQGAHQRLRSCNSVP